MNERTTKIGASMPNIFSPQLKLGSSLSELTQRTPNLSALIAASPAMQRPIAPALAAQIEALQAQWKGLVFQPPIWLLQLREISTQHSQRMASVADHINKAYEPLREVFGRIARSAKECERIEAAGWLPHYTTPFAEAAACGEDAEAVAMCLEDHYTQQWPNVRAAFLERLEKYNIDDEAKATFVEVLDNHSDGRFRGTARTLFPELERVARIELHAGAMEGLTSQRELRDRASDLPLSAAEPGGVYSMALFTKLIDHLYASTKTPDQLAAVAADPVPNRHAALHGFLPYATRQNSVNALIMTDFIFQLVCAMKEETKAADAEEK
ncbi:MAG: hypothetical protein EPN91_03410 [Salinibacterium sp.]|nr:MAG: hypothetical protein EPN91_03410 [Salinibacterium sp.]